jgi:hypothetical protein
MLARPAWPWLLAALSACSARTGGAADGPSGTVDGSPDLGFLSPALDVSAASDAVSRDEAGVEAATADGPAAQSWAACATMVNTGDSCPLSQNTQGCAQLGFLCRCGCQCAPGQGGPPSCGPPCDWRCEFFDWDRVFSIDPPTVHIDCSKPERVVEVRARGHFQGPPDATLAVELGQFFLELGLARGSRPCTVSGPVMPASVGPIAPGTSAGFEASARGTCQTGPTLADPCDSCGRPATAVLGMKVKSGPLSGQWTGRGAGVQPRGTAVTATCTAAP